MKPVFDFVGGRKMFLFFFCFFWMTLIFMCYGPEDAQTYSIIITPLLGMAITGNLVTKKIQK